MSWLGAPRCRVPLRKEEALQMTFRATFSPARYEGRIRFQGTLKKGLEKSSQQIDLKDMRAMTRIFAVIAVLVMAITGVGSASGQVAMAHAYSAQSGLPTAPSAGTSVDEASALQSGKMAEQAAHSGPCTDNQMSLADCIGVCAPASVLPAASTFQRASLPVDRIIMNDPVRGADRQPDPYPPRSDLA